MFIFSNRLCTLLTIVCLGCVAKASEVKIEVTLSPAGSFVARTEKVTGTAFKNGDEIVAKNIRVDVNSLQTGISLRDQHLKKELKSDKFSEVILTDGSGKGGKGTGTLQIMGKAVPLKNGTYSVEDGKVKAQFKLAISEAGIKEISYMSVSVDDEVTVSVELPLGSTPAKEVPTKEIPNKATPNKTK